MVVLISTNLLQPEQVGIKASDCGNEQLLAMSPMVLSVAGVGVPDVEAHDPQVSGGILSRGLSWFTDRSRGGTEEKE